MFPQAVKPASSRSQSAEIFVVGRNYKAPDFIDARMMDPRHAFKQDYDQEGEIYWTEKYYLFAGSWSEWFNYCEFLLYQGYKVSSLTARCKVLMKSISGCANKCISRTLSGEYVRRHRGSCHDLKIELGYVVDCSGTTPYVWYLFCWILSWTGLVVIQVGRRGCRSFTRSMTNTTRGTVRDTRRT